MNKKAFELFDLYRQMLDGEFYGEESVNAANEKCRAIARELAGLGLLILVQPNVHPSKIILPSGEEKMQVTINFTLILVHMPPANQTPIAHGTATSKIFPPGTPKQKTPLSSDLSPEDKKFLRSHDINPNGK
ncbi:MAG: hypothetical protein WAP51_01550 [Candidatus Sungiibacteriota bacterium]